MTDRQLLQHLGRSCIAALSFAVLFVTGVAYSEATIPPQPRTVDAQLHR